MGVRRGLTQPGQRRRARQEALERGDRPYQYVVCGSPSLCQSIHHQRFNLLAPVRASPWGQGLSFHLLLFLDSDVRAKRYCTAHSQRLLALPFHPAQSCVLGQAPRNVTSTLDESAAAHLRHSKSTKRFVYGARPSSEICIFTYC